VTYLVDANVLSEVTMPVKDSMIAATALCHGLKIATRNITDFAPAGVALVNPFLGP